MAILSKVLQCFILCCLSLTPILGIAQHNQAKVEPEVFGLGIISGPEKEFNATFTPDKKRVYFTKSDIRFQRMTIVYSDFKDGQWTTPKVASFSGRWPDGDPFISPDGKRLYYISKRPRSGDEARVDWDLWYVNKKADGQWSNPKWIDTGDINTDDYETYPSISAKGNLYFSRVTILPEGGIKRDMFKTQVKGDSFSEPEKLDIGADFFDPVISPKEDFLILINSKQGLGKGDVFIAFNEKGAWTEPKQLPAPINSTDHEIAPGISPDGKTLYFSSSRIPIDISRSKAISYSEVLNELRGVFNGLGNIYKVELEELLKELKP